MTLQGARRDTRTFDAFSFVTRETIDAERDATADAARRRVDAPFRRTATAERRTTRLLPTGLW